MKETAEERNSNPQWHLWEMTFNLQGQRPEAACWWGILFYILGVQREFYVLDNECFIFILYKHHKYKWVFYSWVFSLFAFKYRKQIHTQTKTKTKPTKQKTTSESGIKRKALCSLQSSSKWNAGFFPVELSYQFEERWWKIRTSPKGSDSHRL